MSPTVTRLVVAVAALAATIVVSACSGSSPAQQHVGHAGTNPPRDGQSAEHNPDDVAVARNMIPHHQQAVEMSAMVPSRSTNPDIIVVAKHISLDQQAEIRTLEGLLVQWGEPVAAHDGGHTGHGGMGMAGMVDGSTLNQLQSLSGAAFDVLWMESMIAHHQGAVTMAQTEIAHGQSPDAVGLARMIITIQQREIAYLNHLLSAPE
jgi:uncharacterized protein (DUF305 family)